MINMEDSTISYREPAPMIKISSDALIKLRQQNAEAEQKKIELINLKKNAKELELKILEGYLAKFYKSDLRKTVRWWKLGDKELPNSAINYITQKYWIQLPETIQQLSQDGFMVTESWFFGARIKIEW